MLPVMERRDARALDRGTLEEMRRLAVTRAQAGETQQVIADSLQVHRCTVAKWVSRHRTHGAAGLARRKAPGRAPTLTTAQQQRLRGWIVGRTPQQLRLPFALWTVPVVGALIAARFDVVVHPTTVLRLLRRMGLTPQRPRRQAFRRDEEACRQWAQTDFPAIVRQAKGRQSTLLFGEEAGVHEDGPVARTWAERGQRPVVRVTGGRRRVNVISVISPRGRLWFRCYDGKLNAVRFIAFLEALLRDVRGPIDLVLDKHPAHTAAVTQRFVHAHRARLRVHFLPSYAPDMNPDEHVWSHVKGLFARQPLEEKEDFAAAVTETMEGIRGDRALVRQFFGHPAVAYVKQALHW